MFAVADAERAEHVAALVRQRFALQENALIITTARNEGASLDDRAPTSGPRARRFSSMNFT